MPKHIAQCGEPSVPVDSIQALVEEVYHQIKLPDDMEDRIERFLEAEVNDQERHRAHPTQFVGKRLQRLAKEKDRLLDLFLAGDIDRETFRARKAKVDAEIVELEARMGDQTDQISKSRDLMQRAIRLTHSCYEGYLKATPEIKRIFNLAFFEEVVVQDRTIVRTKYQEPFRSLFAVQEGRSVLNKELLVEVSGQYQNRFPGMSALLNGGAA